ncbi:MAG: DNA recombination protein RmuC [Gemmatimonadaceae bacterium]
MSPALYILLFLFGALTGAGACAVIYRRLSAAHTAQRISEVTSAGAVREASLGARLEAAERRTADMVQQLDVARSTLDSRDQELRVAHAELTRHKTEEATFTARMAELTASQTQLKDAFQSLCGEALKSNNEQFLQLARTELERVRLTAQGELAEKETAIQSLVTPIRDGLERYDRKLHEIEVARAESFASLTQRIELMSVASDVLRGETANLSKALRSSNVRGAWGELQLKRVVELSGMIEHCDFTTQHSVDGEDGKLRPDVVVRLPGGKSIVVDAKTPATAVLEAVNCPDDDRRKQLCIEHVIAVKKHIEALSRKAYWEQFDHAPEFVVLFLPSEAFFSVALEFDPTLFEHSFEQNVIIATPTTLIALLKAVAFGWRQEAIAENAHQISDLGRELFERIRTLAEHFDRIGDHLGKTVRSYNDAVGSLERRVLSSARRFSSLGVGGTKEIPDLDTLETMPKSIEAAELRLTLPPAGGS